MKRVLASFKRSESSERYVNGSSSVNDDSPEGSIVRAIKQFCESGGGSNSQDPGEEVLHLPTIVDSAESSPTAATEAARMVRKYLDIKNNSTRPYVQYNSIMLLRILSDNPGRTFTRNLADPKFVSVVKDLLKHGRDPSVRQILGETLEYFENTKGSDEGLKGVLEVWAKDKKNLKTASTRSPPPLPQSPSQYPPNIPPRPSPRDQTPHGLPVMEELVSRISESQTSAKLLSQVLQSTPVSEVTTNDLIKEFVERCKAASRSMQAYISADPPADEDTLTTLIETNDQLGIALERYQDALQAAATAAMSRNEFRNDDARVIDVASASVENPFGDPTGEDEGEPPKPAAAAAAPPSAVEREKERQREMERQREKEREKERDERPDSPVSPVTPKQPNYRY